MMVSLKRKLSALVVDVVVPRFKDPMTASAEAEAAIKSDGGRWREMAGRPEMSDEAEDEAGLEAEELGLEDDEDEDEGLEETE